MEEGNKDRPAVVVLATRASETQTEVIVVPVTTSPPRAGENRVEIPATVKSHLGLDDRRSWIVADEVNRFFWPGSDVRLVATTSKTTPYYGKIPGNLLRQVREKIGRQVSRGKLKNIKRSD